MPLGRKKFDALPKIPPKGAEISGRIANIVEILKDKLEEGETLPLSQAAWLVEFDDAHGTGELREQLFGEILKPPPVETPRRAMVPSPQAHAPQVEQERAAGLRVDRIVSVVVEGQRANTELLRSGLDAMNEERLQIQAERVELRTFSRLLFEDQRQLLQLAFTQMGALQQQNLAANETLREGTKALAESEVAVKSAEMAIQVSTAQASAEKQQEGGKLRGKMEDMILGGVAAKLGLPIEFLMDKKETVQAPTNKEE